MKELTRKLVDGGEAALRELIGHAENFDLEFKTKEKADTHTLSKVDKRNLGKALSGFSNADGGLVIFGVKTKKEDHQDIAHELLPIAEIERFKSEVDGRLGELIRPANPSIKTHSIPCTKDQRSGCLLIDIGGSEFRPHMSMAPDHQRYYRRSAEGTLIMDPSLIRDLMMAPKEAHLKLRWRLMGGPSSGHDGKRIYNARFELSIENIGLAMATMPYARIWMNPGLQHMYVDSTASFMRRPDNSHAIYGTRDCVVHPSDEIFFGRYNMTVAVDYEAFKSAVATENWSKAVSPDIWEFGNNGVRNFGALQQEFKTLETRISFGAENAQKQEQVDRFTTFDLIEFALKMHPFDTQIGGSKKAALFQELYDKQKKSGANKER